MICFKAILATDVSFTDLTGKLKTLRAGRSLSVCTPKSSYPATTLDGVDQIECSESYIGTDGDDSFDLSRAEFRTLN